MRSMTYTIISPPATLGFIGLGNMGKPMAKLLAAAGYKLCVNDLNADAISSFCAETGATAASSLQQLGSVSRVVITMLPDGKAVRKVLMEPDGVVSGLRDGAIVIDMSSSSPVDTRALAQQLKAKGFDMIDAP